MRISLRSLIISLFVILNNLSAQEISYTFFKEANDFFNKNVINGRVDYSAIKDNPADLNKLVEIISKYDVSKLQKGILFKNHPDPRLHFVLVCAAIGYPPIINTAYFPDPLNKQLEQRTRSTLNETLYIRVDTNSKTVYVSELFKWYEKDFTQNDLSIIEYINQFRNVKIPENYSVSFITYDWSLNEIPQKGTGSLLLKQENLQAYTPSTLLKPGQIEIKLFNNLYTQTAYFDEESKKKP